MILGATHLLSTAAFDIFFWALLSWLFVRLLRTADDRLWIAIGAVAGVALLNKWNVLFLLVAFALGCLLVPEHRTRLRSPFAVAGGLLALTIWTPNLVWNAQHHWAEVAMLHSLHAENSTLGASIGFLPSQLFVVGPVLAFLWIGGLRMLRTDRIGRVLAIAYVALLIAYVLSGAKSYYLAGIYPSLFGAGGTWYERRLARHPADVAARRARRTAAILVVITVVSLPIVLPVLPERTLPAGSWESGINKDLSATIGWPALVRQVARVADSLPPNERAHLVVFTGDYGAAGAIDEYGTRYGLPHAISGHNNYWWWGPGTRRATVRRRSRSTSTALTSPRSSTRSRPRARLRRRTTRGPKNGATRSLCAHTSECPGRRRGPRPASTADRAPTLPWSHKPLTCQRFVGPRRSARVGAE